MGYVEELVPDGSYYHPFLAEEKAEGAMDGWQLVEDFSVEAGLLVEDDCTELWEGLLVEAGWLLEGD